jgi:isocitrate/isopropylmalate dehydrogenase
MLLEYSFGLQAESHAIFSAVETILEQGFGTEDLSLQTTLSTIELTEKIIASLQR